MSEIVTLILLSVLLSAGCFCLGRAAVHLQWAWRRRRLLRDWRKGGDYDA